MQSSIKVAAVLAAISAGVGADHCAYGTKADAIGNYYCSPVKAITYTGVGMSSSYDEVVGMDPASGKCSSTPRNYSGPIAPLDEEVSLHFAGPLQLKQFAVYMPESTSPASTKSSTTSRHRRDHGHMHQHQKIRAVDSPELEERNVGDVVVATINGKIVSWTSQLPGPTPVAKANNVAQANNAAAYADYPNTGGKQVNQWKRAAYYDSKSQTKEGLTFLNHLGGSGSGVWDAHFGNSLSYAASDGASCAASSQILADTTIPSNKEVVIFSDRPCRGGDCGFYRPNTVAYHGFGGASKIFMFEFAMPDDGTKGEEMNMPAIWMLNAKIPLTSQFPTDPTCSCWASGCGEFDLFETLNSGNTKAKSTFHMDQSAGDSDYFQRPTGAPIKVMAFLDGAKQLAHIQILGDQVEFGSNMTAADVAALMAQYSGDQLSTFDMSNAVIRAPLAS